MSNPRYFAKNIGRLIDNTNNENKKKLISDNFASFKKLSAETQSAILSALPVPDFKIILNYTIDSIRHNCITNSNHDNNVKVLMKFLVPSTFKYNSSCKCAEADSNWFKLCARIDAIEDSGKKILEFKKRKFLHRHSITAGQKAFFLCHMKAWEINICHYIEYNAEELRISMFEFNEAEYKKIEAYLNHFTFIFLMNTLSDRYYNTEEPLVTGI
jgi:hypothetical protein